MLNKSKSHLLKEAQTYFHKALKMDPNYAASYNGLSLVYGSGMDHDKALRNFDKALMIDPKNSIYLQNKACCLKKLKRLDESILYFKQALQYGDADIERIEIYSNLG